MIPETQNVQPFTEADADFPGFWDEFSGLTADVNTLLTDLKDNANVANTGLGQARGLANMLKTFNSDWNVRLSRATCHYPLGRNLFLSLPRPVPNSHADICPRRRSADS